MMASRKALLFKLLRTIVEEWGADEVRDALARLLSSDRTVGPSVGEANAAPKSSQRYSATFQVERAKLKEEQRGPILELARRFDRKEFLPSVADVREFIIMTGARPVSMKDRSEAFRVLLRYLIDLPPLQLTKVVESTSHSGPAQLGPISDAISAAGDRIPRRLQDLGASKNDPALTPD